MSHIATVTRFVLDEFLPDVPESELGPDYDLVAGGVIDSLGLLRLIAWLAERFDLPVDDLELDPDSFRFSLTTPVAGLWTVPHSPNSTRAPRHRPNGENVDLTRGCLGGRGGFDRAHDESPPLGSGIGVDEPKRDIRGGGDVIIGGHKTVRPALSTPKSADGGCSLGHIESGTHTDEVETSGEVVGSNMCGNTTGADEAGVWERTADVFHPGGAEPGNGEGFEPRQSQVEGDLDLGGCRDTWKMREAHLDALFEHRPVKPGTCSERRASVVSGVNLFRRDDGPCADTATATTAGGYDGIKRRYVVDVADCHLNDVNPEIPCCLAEGDRSCDPLASENPHHGDVTELSVKKVLKHYVLLLFSGS